MLSIVIPIHNEEPAILRAYLESQGRRSHKIREQVTDGAR
jgi:hypothetical protein